MYRRVYIAEEFLGILKELKFCEYDDIVLSPEYESEDEVMIKKPLKIPR